MSMTKEDALSKVKELENYIKGLDKKDVVVYIKKWDERPANWNEDGYMDHLCGTLVTIKETNDTYCSIPTEESGDDTEWAVSNAEYVVVEGNIEDLKTRY